MQKRKADGTEEEDRVQRYSFSSFIYLIQSSFVLILGGGVGKLICCRVRFLRECLSTHWTRENEMQSKVIGVDFVHNQKINGNQHLEYV